MPTIGKIIAEKFEMCALLSETPKYFQLFAEWQLTTIFEYMVSPVIHKKEREQNTVGYTPTKVYPV